jgi:ferredoxin-thioredoxin reductase catalytic subunit
MSVFREMAAKEKAAAQARIEEARAQEAKRKQERLNARGRAQAALAKHILPLLVEAKRAFDEAGVPCRIAEHLDLEPPQITFQCVGEKMEVGEGGTLAPKSVFLVVEASDNTEVKVSTTKEEDTFSAMIERGRSGPADFMDVLAKVLPMILRSYYDNLEIVRQHRNAF